MLRAIKLCCWRPLLNAACAPRASILIPGSNLEIRPSANAGIFVASNLAPTDEKVAALNSAVAFAFDISRNQANGEAYAN